MNKEELIKATILGEEHLGENLKGLCIEYIDNLQQENQKYKEVIDKIMNLIKQYGKYDGKKCTRGFQMWSADFNKILDILKEVE